MKEVAGFYLNLLVAPPKPRFTKEEIRAVVAQAVSGGTAEEQLSKWAELHMSNFYRWLRGEGINSKAVVRFKKVKGATGRYVLGSGWPKNAKRFVNAPKDHLTRAKHGVVDGYAEP